MRKKIAILGSTGSIGKTTINIIKKDKKNFEIVLLTSNQNYKELLKQVREFNPKNIIINNYKKYLYLKKKLKFKKINIFNHFNEFNKFFKNKKLDYTMCAISGLSGLKPTLDAITFSKKIAIANKESIICGWNLIEKKLKKFKTEFIPVDSEHFSIWKLLNDSKDKDVDEILLTASGGPFLKLPIKNFKYIKPSNAIKHPNWSMGKKISIDSSTLMNKVFEVIEAKKIFNINLDKFKVVIHPKSYVHAIVKFNNGLTKILIHDTNMKIPIFNSIYKDSNKHIKSNKLNFSYLNNLDFKKVDLKRFPAINFVKKIPKNNSLFETIIVSSNDELVNMFLDNKIKYKDIVKNLKKIINSNQFHKYKRIIPKNFKQIFKLSEYVRLKTRSLSI